MRVRRVNQAMGAGGTPGGSVIGGSIGGGSMFGSRSTSGACGSVGGTTGAFSESGGTTHVMALERTAVSSQKRKVGRNDLQQVALLLKEAVLLEFAHEEVHA